MLRNYFITAIRNIRRNAGYAFINIFGLSLGVACCLVLFLVVRYELGYDQFNKKADRIYRITLNAVDFNPSVSMAITPAMRTDFPQLEAVSQFVYQYSGMVLVDQKRYEEKGFGFADAQFANIFDYQWMAGDSKTALSEPNTVVLTESIAKKYFGNTDPIGKVIRLNNEYELRVTGMIRDLPGNTHLPFTFMVSFETIRKKLDGALRQFYWITGGAFTYVVLPKNYSVEQFKKQIPAFIAKNWGKDIAKEARLIPQPLNEIHFDQRYLNNTISPTTSKETYWSLAVVAIFVIIIACINFINLATAQATKRSKEVGVRKVLGAARSQLIAQFLGETTFLVLLSVAIGVLATRFLLPLLSTWMDIRINAGQLLDPNVVLLIIIITILVILLSGLYPAFVQSSFQPATTLRATKGGSYRGLSLRKSLVVIQFAISQIMIVGTLIVASQMDFFRNRDLGFNKEAVVTFGIPDESKRDVLEQELKSNPGVKAISFSSGAPMVNGSFTSFVSPESGMNKGDVTEMKSIDEHYMDMFELKMLSGDKILKVKSGPDDTVYNVVVNEALLQKANIQDPAKAIGMHIILNGNWHCTIQGVVKDFQSESKHKKIRPCVLFYRQDVFYSASVKIQPGHMQSTMSRIDKDWSALFPKEIFKYEFLDDRIADMYKQEQKLYTAFKLFSSVAILIGCLGLYGLISFAAVQRSKEVGIRKVLGASLPNIVSLFAKEFVGMILIAFVLAAPIAYFVMHGWLENFAYHIGISAGIFMVALAASFLISSITISFESFRAAFANPVKALRSE